MPPNGVILSATCGGSTGMRDGLEVLEQDDRSVASSARARLRPTSPQSGVPPVSHGSGASFRYVAANAGPWLLGAHGGAGTSALVNLIPGAVDADRSWPIPRSLTPSRVLVVTRSNASGLLAAQRLATQWASGTVPRVDLLGLLVVADAPGRRPRALRDLERLVIGGFPKSWEMPWLESWRFEESDVDRSVPALDPLLAALCPLSDQLDHH